MCACVLCVCLVVRWSQRLEECVIASSELETQEVVSYIIWILGTHVGSSTMAHKQQLFLTSKHSL